MMRSIHFRPASRHRLLLPALLLLAGCSGRPAAGPVRVVLFIGDGVGVAHWTAALVTTDSLAVGGMPVTGLMDTRADPDLVTDSAAAASALATGRRTRNGRIAMDREGEVLETVVEVAEQAGRATGLVVTCSLTHATPAAFVAHVISRNRQEEIAEQMAGAGVEVLLGGGVRYFDGARRRDGRDLLTGLREIYPVVTTAQELRALDVDRTERLLGLFADEHPPAAPQREPTLAEMTSIALRVLAHDPDGFFLMVEGSQPDWLAHDHEPLEALAVEVIDFDRAVAVALAFRQAYPELLVVVTADHETGGLAVVDGGGGRPVAAYTTGGHSASLVPLFAAGPGAGRFSGLKTNAEVGRLLLEIVRGGEGP